MVRIPQTLKHVMIPSFLITWYCILLSFSSSINGVFVPPAGLRQVVMDYKALIFEQQLRLNLAT